MPETAPAAQDTDSHLTAPPRPETAPMSPWATKYLAGVRARHAAAQGGGWYLAPESHAEPGTVRTTISGYQRTIGVFDFRGTPAEAEANRQFVLYAPSDIGFLLDQIDRLRTRIAEVVHRQPSAQKCAACGHNGIVHRIPAPHGCMAGELSGDTTCPCPGWAQPCNWPAQPCMCPGSENARETAARATALDTETTTNQESSR